MQVPSADANLLQSLEDFLSLGRNTVLEIENAIDLAKEDLRQILEELKSNIEDLLDTLSQTFQENLQVALNSLDATLRNQLLTLESFFGNINSAIQSDIALASDEAQAVIRSAGLEVRRTTAEIENGVESVIIVGGEAAVYVIDRTTDRVVVVVVVLLLGVGILILIWLVTTRRVQPWSAGLMGLFLVLFISLLLPSSRAAVMRFSGVGLQATLDRTGGGPRIFDLVPSSVVIGQTEELEIWGSELMPRGEEPAVLVGSASVPVRAASPDRVVVAMTGVTGPTGSVTLRVRYSRGEGLRTVVKLIPPPVEEKPPDLTLTDLAMTPAQAFENQAVTATATLRNDGDGPALGILVAARRSGVDIATQDTLEIARLEPGASMPVVFHNLPFPEPGTFEVELIVDPYNAIEEEDEHNNLVLSEIAIVERPPELSLVTVTFLSLYVADDHEDVCGGAAGEYELHFDVLGRTQNWNNDVYSGETYELNIEMPAIQLARGQRLLVQVTGNEDDDFPCAGDDRLGSVSDEPSWEDVAGVDTFGSTSRNPSDYRITYEVRVEELPQP
jgi:hypothetical protein